MADLSQLLTLEAGDIILAGSFTRPMWVFNGDTVHTESAAWARPWPAPHAGTGSHVALLARGSEALAAQYIKATAGDAPASY